MAEIVWKFCGCYHGISESYFAPIILSENFHFANDFNSISRARDTHSHDVSSLFFIETIHNSQIYWVYQSAKFHGMVDWWTHEHEPTCTYARQYENNILKMSRS